MLNLPASVEAKLLSVPPGASRLVVPDVEAPVGGLVDAVNRAAEQERPSIPQRDRDRIAARHGGPRHRSREAEGDLEESGRELPAVRLFELEKRAAGKKNL